MKLWRTFADCFMCMPVAAVVADRILCMHGGLSPDLTQVSQIFEIRRPCDIPDEGLLCDLLWADPEPGIAGWGYNARGVSYIFGHDVVTEFLDVSICLYYLGVFWCIWVYLGVFDVCICIDFDRVVMRSSLQ